LQITNRAADAAGFFVFFLSSSKLGFFRKRKTALSECGFLLDVTSAGFKPFTVMAVFTGLLANSIYGVDDL
jgi:hypothetical protein